MGGVAQLLGLGEEDAEREWRYALSGGAVEWQAVCRKLARKPPRCNLRRAESKAATYSGIIRKFLTTSDESSVSTQTSARFSNDADIHSEKNEY